MGKNKNKNKMKQDKLEYCPFWPDCNQSAEKCNWKHPDGGEEIKEWE